MIINTGAINLYMYLMEPEKGIYIKRPAHAACILYIICNHMLRRHSIKLNIGWLN